jgi:hypothetical protein
MEIVDNMDLYNPHNVIPLVISILLFVLYVVITLIDTNIFIKEYGIGDEVIGTGKFLYSYVAGYFVFFLKLATSMMTLYILLSLIRIAIVAIFNIFRPIALGGAGADDFKGTIFGKVKTALKNNALWILGIYMFERFLMSFIIYAPILILLIIIGYGWRIYNYKSLKELEELEQNEEVLRALKTTHNHMMFLLSIFVSILIIYIVGVYVQTFNLKNPEFLEGTEPLPTSGSH